MKILLACPILDIRFEWMQGFLSIYKELLYHKEWEIELYMPYRMPVSIADTKMVRKAIKENFDYIVRMDDDVWDVPYGTIKKFINFKVDMVSAVMYAHGYPYQRCAMNKKDKTKSLIDIAKNKEYIELEECGNRGLQPVDFVAFPFTLFKVDMFKKIPEPWFNCDEEIPTDSFFCQKMLDNGFQPHVDMDTQVTHRGVTCWNRKYRLMGDASFQIATGQLKPNNPLYDIAVENMGLKEEKLITIGR